jgi:hypothetical protein
MKILNILVSIVILTLCAGTVSAQMNRHDFERSPNFDKLDLRAKEAWRTAVSAGDKKTELECMLKVTDRLTPDQKNQLGLTGFKAGTIIQTIVTGRVTVENLPKVAALNFVKVVELAVPLNLKAKPGYKKNNKPEKKKMKRTPTSKPVGKAPKVGNNKSTLDEAETPVEELESPPADLPSSGSQVPIYESTPPSQTPDPNRPMTSDDVQPSTPAIAPVDQPPPVVEPERTATQPAVEPAQKKPEFEDTEGSAPASE